LSPYRALAESISKRLLVAKQDLEDDDDDAADIPSEP
jgi:hypothetical protein